MRSTTVDTSPGRLLGGGPVVPDRAAAERLRTSLAYGRRIGLDFDTAWTDAVLDGTRGLPRREAREWAEAFEWARPAFRAAYEAERPVVLALAGMVE